MKLNQLNKKYYLATLLVLCLLCSCKSNYNFKTGSLYYINSNNGTFHQAYFENGELKTNKVIPLSSPLNFFYDLIKVSEETLILEGVSKKDIFYTVSADNEIHLLDLPHKSTSKIDNGFLPFVLSGHLYYLQYHRNNEIVLIKANLNSLLKKEMIYSFNELEKPSQEKKVYRNSIKLFQLDESRILMSDFTKRNSYLIFNLSTQAVEKNDISQMPIGFKEKANSFIYFDKGIITLKNKISHELIDSFKIKDSINCESYLREIEQIICTKSGKFENATYFYDLRNGNLSLFSKEVIGPNVWLSK